MVKFPRCNLSNGYFPLLERVAPALQCKESAHDQETLNLGEKAMKSPSTFLVLASLLVATTVTAAPLEQTSTETRLQSIQVAGITWMSAGRKSTKIELAVANLGPRNPKVTVHFMAADGSVLQSETSDIRSRRAAPMPGYEIVRIKVNTAPASRGTVKFGFELSDPVTGRHDNFNPPTAAMWKGDFSAPPRQILFHACYSGWSSCGEETSSGVLIHDGTNSYFVARPGSSANPISQ